MQPTPRSVPRLALTFALAIALALVAAAFPVAAQDSGAGGLRVLVRCLDAGDTALVVRADPLPVDARGAARRPGTDDLLRLLDSRPAHAVRAAAPDGAAEVVFEELPAGPYIVFAFADRNGNGRWDPDLPEPCGWHAAEPAGFFDPVVVLAAVDGDGDPPAAQAEVALRAPTPFPAEHRATEHGTLTRVRGYPVLQLSGDARERGFAHGFLVARQILDFFEFYLLEERFRSARSYQGEFAPFLESHFAWPDELLAEAGAVIEGMRAAGVPLRVPALGRDFGRTDLLAINSYIESRAMRSSCTQFAAWGDDTLGTDVGGGMITGRNMDGEIDLRRTTVHGFLLFAVAPSEPGHRRFVSMMWPGFIGTLSGINEDGFYSMENAGPTGPGPVVEGLVPIAWTQRQALATLGAHATPATVEALLDESASRGGGACGPGSVILWAVPYAGQAAPAFVYEGDRFGGAMRLPGAVRPFGRQSILGSNHYHVYGCDPAQPMTNFGRRPGFSSLWRYEAGMHKLESFQRTGRRIGTEEMRELLQCACHGTTEYAVVTRPDERTFDVSVASELCEGWDAPYRAWTRFGFDELFAGMPR